MTLQNQMRAWSYGRQRLDRSATDPLTALEAVIAVHGTHPPAPLSLLARTPGFEYEAYDRLIQDRKAINFATMRGSVHLQPTSFAPNLLAATRSNPAALRKRLGVDDKEYAHLRDSLLPKLGTPVAGSGIRETLAISDHEFLAVRMLARAGEVLRIPTAARSDRLQYVSTAAWLGEPIAEVDAADARVWLAGAYLDAFGPARVADFAWWVGIPKRDAQAAFDALDLTEISPALFLPTALVDEYARTPALEPGSLAILPKWDSYTMGYAPDGRDRLVAPADLQHAYTTTETRTGATTGDGFPLILQNGQAVARWSHRFAGKTMTVSIEAFPGHTVDLALCKARFQEIASLLGCSKLQFAAPTAIR